MITAATIAPINAPATIALSESRKEKKKIFLSINPAKSHRNLVEDPLPERRHSVQRPKKLSMFFQERGQRYSRKKRTGLLWPFLPSFLTVSTLLTTSPMFMTG